MAGCPVHECIIYNNLMCLTMTFLPFYAMAITPPPPNHLVSTWLPRARLPLPDSCFHCSCLLRLPKALLRCMAARLDHQKWQCGIDIDCGPSADSNCSLLQTIKGRTEYGGGAERNGVQLGRNLHGKLFISDNSSIYFVFTTAFSLFKHC